MGLPLTVAGSSNILKHLARYLDLWYFRALVLEVILEAS